MILWDCGSAYGVVQPEDPAEVTSYENSVVLPFGLSHHISSYHDGFSNFILNLFARGKK